MNKLEQVRHYYEAGLWSAVRVRHAVEKGWITPEDYAVLIGEPYRGGEG